MIRTADEAVDRMRDVTMRMAHIAELEQPTQADELRFELLKTDFQLWDTTRVALEQGTTPDQLLTVVAAAMTAN
jgi:hypothetical protein